MALGFNGSAKALSVLLPALSVWLSVGSLVARKFVPRPPHIHLCWHFPFSLQIWLASYTLFANYIIASKNTPAKTANREDFGIVLDLPARLHSAQYLEESGIVYLSPSLKLWAESQNYLLCPNLPPLRPSVRQKGQRMVDTIRIQHMGGVRQTLYIYMYIFLWGVVFFSTFPY